MLSDTSYIARNVKGESARIPIVLVEKLDMDAIKRLTGIDYKKLDMDAIKRLTGIDYKKQRKRQISSTDSEDSDSDEFQVSSTDSDDSDFQVRSIARRKNYVKSTKKVNKKTKRVKNKEVGMSAYEKMVEQKRQESLAFLQSLKINEVKSSLSEVVNAIQQKVPTKYRKKKPTTEGLELRKQNKRSKKLPVNYSEVALSRRRVVGSTEEIEVDDIQPIPSRFSFRNALKSNKIYVRFKEDIEEALDSKEKRTLYNDSIIQKLPLKLSNDVVITPERIACLAWYPSPDYMVLAAGSRLGNIAIWNVNLDSDSPVFKVHNESITHLKFNPFNRVELFSSSLEGTLRCGDMVKTMFTEVLNYKKIFCSYFEFITSTTYLVGLSNGNIKLVDGNVGRRSVIENFCHSDSIKTVNMHPVNRNVFVTAGSKGSVRLWDLRMLQKQPIADIIQHSRVNAVNSAFFSPVTGNSLLTKSNDGSICIFNSSNLTQGINLIRRFTRKSKSEGEWYFTSEWLPNSDDIFVVSNVQPSNRRIKLHDKHSSRYHLLMPEEVKLISCNTFHPFVPSIACYLQSRKRVAVFA